MLGGGVEAADERLVDLHPAKLTWHSPMSSEFRRGRHVVFKLHAHLVFTPKYRGGVITERVWEVLRAAFERVCVDFGATLEEIGRAHV